MVQNENIVLFVRFIISTVCENWKEKLIGLLFGVEVADNSESLFFVWELRVMLWKHIVTCKVTQKPMLSDNIKQKLVIHISSED